MVFRWCPHSHDDHINFGNKDDNGSKGSNGNKSDKDDKGDRTLHKN